MKKIFTLSLLLSLISMSMSAFYPAVFRTGDGYYPDAVMDIEHDAQYVYVASGYGLFVIDKTTGEQTVFSAREGTLDYTPISLAMYGDDLWIGTAEGKLLCYNNGSIQVYDLGIGGRLSNIAFDSNGNMYISDFGVVGYKINMSSKTIEEQFETFNRYSEGITSHLCIDGNDALWIGNYGGMAMTKYGLGKYTKVKGTQYMIKDHPEWPGYYVSSMAVDDDGCMWYVNYGNTEIGKWLTKIENDEVAVSYECPCFGYDMMFDRQQRLWMLGKNGPLFMMKDGEFSSYSCTEESNVWTCIDIDGDDIYIGTDKGVLRFKNNTFSVVPVEASSPSGIANTSIMRPATDNVFFDLQGRQLNGKPEKGIYIQNGKKIRK